MSISYLDRLDLKLKRGILVGDNHGVRVQLQTRQGPHVVDALLDAALQRERLALAQDDDDDLAGFENGLDADGKGHARHLVDVAVKEARVGEDGVVGERLDAGAAGQAGAWLVEGDVAVLANAREEEVDAAVALDGVLVGDALGLEAGGVAVEDVDVGRVDVDVGEEVLPHEGMVRLRVVSGNTHVLVHVEGDDILKRNLAKASGVERQKSDEPRDAGYPPRRPCTFRRGAYTRLGGWSPWAGPRQRGSRGVGLNALMRSTT